MRYRFPRGLAIKKKIRKQFLEHLHSKIVDFQTKKIESETFHEQCTEILVERFKTTQDPKKINMYKEIKSIIEEITAVSRDLKVRHEVL